MKYIKVEAFKEFSPDKQVRKKLLGTEKIVAELVCYEPGQSTPKHPHPKQDEIFYVVEGTGTMLVGDEEIHVEPGTLILVPARTLHGVQASNDSRLVLMFVKAPGSTSSTR